MKSKKTPDFGQRVLKELTPRLLEATVPLYVVKNGQFIPNRTGVLVQIHTHLFIFTAAHGKLGKFPATDTILCGGFNFKTGLPCALMDSAVSVSEDDDLRDLGIIRPGPKSSKELLRLFKPVSLDSVEPIPNPSDGYFLVLGYPGDWFSVQEIKNKKALFSYPMPFITDTFRRMPQTIPNFRYRSHVHTCVGFDRDVLGVTTRAAHTLPKLEGLKGISGCGIWRICGKSSREVNSWKVEDVLLAGIQHRVSIPGKYIVGTRMQYGLGMLMDVHPAIRPIVDDFYNN